ncbi:anti-repressor SinI family protein [Bacillus sp. ISL-53]|nr:anti-repressor SinI family protein [Bacillus sp. ISL-53]
MLIYETLSEEWLELVTLAMKSDKTKEEFKKFLEDMSNCKFKGNLKTLETNRQVMNMPKDQKSHAVEILK